MSNLTHEDYIKRRDEILVKVTGYNHAGCENCAYLAEYKRAIDELVLAVIGEGASFGVEIERLEHQIKKAIAEDRDDVTITITTNGIRSIVKGGE
jgi:hypothetical protein